ncbi:MAG: DegV family protein [Thermoleophilaceae bacterium]|nr:DegV family protein [Thermoleophilaceae bacterium]
MPVRVVGDSTSYLTPAQIADYGITEVSLAVVWNDRSVPELEITDLDAFYDELRGMKDLPGTSQPSIGQFLEVYEPIIAAGDDIVSLHFSSGISGTYESAVQAKQQLVRDGVDPLRVTVLDTGSACGGYGAILLSAASAARRGAGHGDVVSAAHAMMDGLNFWFAIDTLEYLRRGGRIGAVASVVGGAIKIKPILTVTTEGIVPVEKVRTEARVLARIADLGQEHIPEGGGFIVQHVQAPERAQKVIDDLSSRLGREPAFVPGEIGPVIGAHVGPGLIGVGVFPSGLIDA